MVQCKPFEPALLTRSAASGPRLAPAEVILVKRDAVVVSFGVQQAEAKIAIVDYDASPGDRLLIIGDDVAGYFAIGVLATALPRPRLKVESSTNGATIVSVENGDLEVVAPRGAVRILASTGFEATTLGPIQLNSRVGICMSILDRVSRALKRIRLTPRSMELQHEQVDVTAGRLHVAARDSSIKAEEAAVNVGSASLIARRMNSEIGTLLSKIENAYQRVTDLWQLAAKRTRLVVEETSHHKARRIYSKADDVKVKADQIHLG